jgi:hypothetical protein
MYHRAMPTPVDSRSRPCERRVLVPRDRISGYGHMKLLRSLPLQCAACGGREVGRWLFVRRDAAEAWAEG